MIISIDIGGTNIRVASICKGLNFCDKIKFKSDVNFPMKSLDKIVTFINKIEKVSGIGISAPGPADYKRGVILNAPNLPGWNNFNIVEYLIKKTGIKNIKMENDANLMALANHHYFNGSKKDVTQFFTISTGLGAGLVINNKIFTGSKGYAQEVANMPLAWKKESSESLGSGALESFSSGSGIEHRGKMFGNSAKEIINNPLAKEIINDAIETLSNAIASSSALLNPSIIIFDGSVARYNEGYINSAINLSKKRMFKEQFDSITFKMAELGDDAGLIGAYHLINNS